MPKIEPTKIFYNFLYNKKAQLYSDRMPGFVSSSPLFSPEGVVNLKPKKANKGLETTHTLFGCGRVYYDQQFLLKKTPHWISN